MRVPFVPNTVKLLLAVLVVAFLVAVSEGYIPDRYSPFATVDLEDPYAFFVDWRLSQLGADRATCKRVFASPLIKARPAADKPIRDGCGWVNAFRVSELAGARLSPIVLRCPEAAALAMWMAHVVQPAARRHLGARITRIRHVGGYACRNIRGWITKYVSWRSEHAKANALDLTGFQLSNGQSVSIARHWTRGGPKAAFLREVHEGACQYFRVALGPDANRLHADHFHLDRGVLRSCR